jgi:hypothetical protein
MTESTATTHRSPAQILIAAIFVLLTLNAVKETFWSDGPLTLRMLQAIMCAIAAATAWGAWSAARWASASATLYGFVTAGMLVALEPMLGLPADARNGLWTGAGVVLLFSLACAWFLRRLTRRASVDVTEVL